MNIPWLQKNVALDKAIVEAISQLDAYPADSPEYAQIVKNITKMQKVRTSKKSRPRISPDAVLTIAGNIVAVILITNYEKENSILSKAPNIIPKAFRG